MSRVWYSPFIVQFAAALALAAVALAEPSAKLEEDISKGRAWGRTAEGLALSIATEKRTYAPGEQIVLNVLLRNFGETPVLLIEQNPLWSYRPTVLFPDGKKAPITIHGKTVSEDDVGSGISECGHLLEPGEMRCVEFVMNKLYDFTRSGKYTVSVRRMHFAPAEKGNRSSGSDPSVFPQAAHARD